MIKHDPIFETESVEEIYSERDGVAVKYMCTSALGDEAVAMDIFYRDTPHPEFGNRYFGLFVREGETYITNADRIEQARFSMIKDLNGDLHYSAHRHDCKKVDGKMIDGGRAYVRSDTITYPFKIKDGEFVEIPV